MIRMQGLVVSVTTLLRCRKTTHMDPAQYGRLPVCEGAASCSGSNIGGHGSGDQVQHCSGRMLMLVHGTQLILINDASSAQMSSVLCNNNVVGRDYICRLHFCVQKWGFSSVGRASALHAEGQGFDSPNLHSLFALC